MAASDQTREGEIVLRLPGFVFGPGIQQFLNALPAFARYERFMRASVDLAVSIKLAQVQAFARLPFKMRPRNVRPSPRNWAARRFTEYSPVAKRSNTSRTIGAVSGSGTMIRLQWGPSALW